LFHETEIEKPLAIRKTKGEKELEDLEIVFKALAHQSRRFILIALQARGGTMTAGDIVGRFDSSWPTMTRHLQQLEEANLISVEKVGREQYYSLNKERLKKTAGTWLKWFEN
jgi:ArsR family transcriptional regulator, arsenate/arsenite/antimonite-responsive transcriptional repressor